MFTTNPFQAIKALNFLHPDGTVFELCVIGPKKPACDLWTGRTNGKKTTISGWYRDPKMAVELAIKISEKIKAEGIYTTLNPCKEDYLARADHRLEASIHRTEDKHIEAYKNLLIDVDANPGGVSGVSSTDVEHEAALEMVQIIQTDLNKDGWPEPMRADSGNGGHLIYPLDLPNTPESVTLIKTVLTALALRYQDDLARCNLGIDTGVYNPARLTKLYGTWVRKGDNTSSRPHRIASVIALPEKRIPVPLDLLEKLADSIPKHEQAKPKDTGTGKLDVPAYLQHYGREVVQVKPHGNAVLYLLGNCVFDESHTRKESYIGQRVDGGLFYDCKHNSCKGRTWAEARKSISGDDKLSSFMIGAPPYSERTRASSTGVCGDLEKAIQNGTLTTEQKAYLINLIGNNGETSQPDNLAADIKELILSSSGHLKSSDVIKELGLSSLSSDRRFNQNLSNIFGRLVKEGFLERTERRGEFLIVNQVAEEIPWKNVGIPTPVNLKQPLNLHEMVNFYSGNIVVVGGTYNAGKTVYCLNTAFQNRNDWKVNYLSSEMIPEELAARLYKFKKVGLIQNINEWNKVRFRQRCENFHQVIDPDALDIIDYLELTKEFYAVGGMIDKIFQNLNKGVALIAIQKAPGEVHARGGAFTVEKARFAVSIDYQKLKIVKAKNLKPGVKDPTNKVIEFSIDDGTRMIRTE